MKNLSACASNFKQRVKKRVEVGREVLVRLTRSVDPKGED